MSVSPFTIDVADLRKDVGRQRPAKVEVSVEWGTDSTVTVADVPLRAELELQSISGGVMVTGEARFTTTNRCDRCLTEWTSHGQIRVAQLYGDDPDAEYLIEGDELDLEPMLRDEVVLSMPLRPVCREDCAGLCPTCGADLNTGDCSGHEDTPSSPFAGLRELLETQE